MSGLYDNFLIYGADTDIKDSNYLTIKYPLKTAVSALPKCITCLPSSISGYWGAVELDSDTRELASGGKLIINKAKLTWNVQFMPINFSTSNVNADIVFLKNVLNKRYKWIDLRSYPYRPTEILNDTTKLVAVNVTGFSVSASNGQKTISIQLTERP